LIHKGSDEPHQVGETGFFGLLLEQHSKDVLDDGMDNLPLNDLILASVILVEDVLHEVLGEVGEDLNGGVGEFVIEGDAAAEGVERGVEGDVDDIVERVAVRVQEDAAWVRDYLCVNFPLLFLTSSKKPSPASNSAVPFSLRSSAKSGPSSSRVLPHLLIVLYNKCRGNHFDSIQTA
jgi:hypothetical protein